MSKLEMVARTLRKEGEKALVLYLTAGYPDRATFIELVHAATLAGCDIIEIGVPFSDPIADGPVIQKSSQRALSLGVSLTDTISMTKRIASDVEIPLVLMSYVNPILQLGVEQFSQFIQPAGISGVILPDVPYEESCAFRNILDDTNVTYIDMLAPTSGRERIKRITSGARGFIYLVSVTGVTGSRAETSQGLDSIVTDIRATTKVPLYVGFGISSPEQARKVSKFSDGVIMGTAIIERVMSSSSHVSAVEDVVRLIRDVKDAMNN